jgi:hypothetical protein
MSTVTFHCRKCGATLSSSVRLVAEGVDLRGIDGQPALNSGQYAVSDGEHFTRFAGCFVLHLSDVVGTRRHSDRGRLNGCCGLDGCDGPNILCECGAEIGTEKSDCWMPHGLLLDPTAVDPRPT